MRGRLQALDPQVSAFPMSLGSNEHEPWVKSRRLKVGLPLANIVLPDFSVPVLECHSFYKHVICVSHIERMYVCIYTHTYIHPSIHACIYIHTYVHTYIHAYMSAYMVPCRRVDSPPNGMVPQTLNPKP